MDDSEAQKLTDWKNKIQICRHCGIPQPFNVFYFRRDTQNYHTLCKKCWGKTTGRVLIDYSKNKRCKQCHKLKDAKSFTKNGKRTKNTCKTCASTKNRKNNKIKKYPNIIKDIFCRTCGCLVKVQNIYIENRRNNKASTQCKTCYMVDATIRKHKRRVLIKDLSQKLTSKERIKIRKIYKQCMHLNQNSLICYNVDHIRPISKGGIHHSDNLQIITEYENKIKGAKYAE